MERKRTEERIPIVVLGEQDHGKSTLLGRLLYETGGLPADRLRGIRNAARTAGKRFEWAHALDAFRYEREREMTLDTSRIIAKIGRRLYECIDVPGHHELIKNMLSGASDARYAVLVVAATSGMTPQALLHLEIAKFLGIRKLVAVINKCDLVGYSQERFERQKLEMAAFVRKAGFGTATVLPLNAATGNNMRARTSRLRWFRGPTLFQALEHRFPAPPRRGTRGAPVIAVQDAYRNSIIVGHVVQGRVLRGERVVLMPRESRHLVQRIFVGGKETTAASAGDQIGVLLSPAARRIRRGDVIAKKPFRYSRTLSGPCLFTEQPPKSVVIETGFQKSKAALAIDRRSFAVGRPVPGTLTLQDAMAVTDRFVIKKDGAIIGIGRTANS